MPTIQRWNHKSETQWDPSKSNLFYKRFNRQMFSRWVQAYRRSRFWRGFSTLRQKRWHLFALIAYFNLSFAFQNRSFCHELTQCHINCWIILCKITEWIFSVCWTDMVRYLKAPLRSTHRDKWRFTLVERTISIRVCVCAWQSHFHIHFVETAYALFWKRPIFLRVNSGYNVEIKYAQIHLAFYPAWQLTWKYVDEPKFNFLFV